jgi:A/G-specific adenine glycosylase
VRCEAHARGETDRYPTPRPRRKLPEKAVHLLMALSPDDQQILLEKRPPQGIWGGLWSFPELALEAPPHEAPHPPLKPALEQRLKAPVADIELWEPVWHTFTHFKMAITPVKVSLAHCPGPNGVMESTGARWHNLAQPAALGLAAPVKSLLKRLQGQAA